MQYEYLMANTIPTYQLNNNNETNKPEAKKFLKQFIKASGKTDKNLKIKEKLK